MRIWLLCPLMLCGCTAAIKELHKGPFPYAVSRHTRAVGIEMSVPSQTGDSIIKLRLGWFSDTIHLTPSTVNHEGNMSTATISDDFKLENEVSFSPKTKIIESYVTGFKDKPPEARYSTLFSTNAPALRPITVNTNAP